MCDAEAIQHREKQKNLIERCCEPPIDTTSRRRLKQPKNRMRMQSYSGNLGQRTYQIVCDVRLVREVVFLRLGFYRQRGSDAHASGHRSGAVGAIEVPLGAAPRDIGGVKAVAWFEVKLSRNRAPALSDEGHGLSPASCLCSPAACGFRWQQASNR